MSDLKLLRQSDFGELGVFGEVTYLGNHVCYTVEKTWENNTPFISCIPAGLYELEDFGSRRYGSVVVLVNPALEVYRTRPEAVNGGRYACLFHAANKASQVQGCIAPGQRRGMLDGEWAVTRSRAALNELMPLLKSCGQIEITWSHATP